MSGERRIIGLVANRELRRGPGSPLVRLMRELEPYFRYVLEPEIHAVEGTYRALLRYGVLRDYPHLHPLPPGRRGGLVALTDRVVEGAGGGEARVDEVVYINDPRDYSAMLPDSLALKRQCVVTETPFLATCAAAREWYALDWCLASAGGGRPHPEVAAHFPEASLLEALGLLRAGASLDGDTLALVAHDSRKLAMLEFAEAHFPLLARFRGRLATGTTGSLLNGRLPERLRRAWDDLDRQAAVFEGAGALPEDLAEARATAARVAACCRRLAGQPATPGWVDIQPSGPKGGDVRIAEAVRRGDCRRVIFFEDPHVSREHEADIQLLERTTRIPEHDALLLHDVTSARCWARRWERCLEAGRRPLNLAQCFRRLWGVELVLADDGGVASVALQAARYLQGLVTEAVLAARGAGRAARLGLTWGVAAAGCAAALATVRQELAALGQTQRDLVHVIAGADDLQPGHFMARPLLGVMGFSDGGHEANDIAERVAVALGGDSGPLSGAAFCTGGPPAGEAAGGADCWEALDAALLSCEPLAAARGALPAPVLEQLAGRCAGMVAGVFLDASGKEIELQGWRRLGASRADLQGAAQRGGSLLMVPADAGRVEPALAALRAGVAAVLVTDRPTAWEILERQGATA